jgi:DNA-binding CsgD family transcriptional regulator
MKRADPDGFEALIGSIYEAALAPTQWGGVLEQVRLSLGGSNALLFTPNLGADDGLWVGLIFTKQAAVDYAAYFHDKDLWYHAAHRQRWLRSRPLFFSNELVPPADFARSEFYNGHSRQFDMFHACWSVTPGHAPRDIPLSAFGFYRGERAEPFTATDIRILKRVSGHLQRALEIHWRLGSAPQGSGEGLALLEHLPFAVLLVSESGTVIHENSRAAMLLSAQDGIAQRGGRLTAQDPLAHRTLVRLIGRSAQTGNGQPECAGGAVAIRRPSGKPAWQVLVTPLPVAAGRPHWAVQRVCAAVFIGDPEARVQLPEMLLQAWYGLTPAEARVALDVANGFTPREIAERGGLSWHTVRAHFKTIYEKMDVRRESQLVRKVMACPGMGIRNRS